MNAELWEALSRITTIPELLAFRDSLPDNVKEEPFVIIAGNSRYHLIKLNEAYDNAVKQNQQPA